MNAVSQGRSPQRRAVEPKPVPGYIRWERAILAACIVLAPLSLFLYALSWPVNPGNVVVNSTKAFMVDTSIMAGTAGNTLHFVGGVAASFFLPIGYLGMSLLGMRRSPVLARICAALSLVGWIPWAALMGIDLLAYDIARIGRTPQLDALWLRFNGDPVMVTYLVIYVVGHLVSAVLIAIMLRRLRLIPLWSACAFALTSPLTMALFITHSVEAQSALRYALAVLWIGGVIPAAVAMLRGYGDEGGDEGSSDLASAGLS